MNKLIEIKKLAKKYYDNKGETLAIEDITLDVYDGEFLTIVGPSGCGKSTFLNIVGGIDKATSGMVKCDANIKIGYMLQSDCLFPWLTILDNALLGLKIQRMLTKENINYVENLLKTYGLGEFIDAYPSSLSGGMKQRVALIRTLALKPDILLLDEPFSALDYQTRLMVADDVYKIIKKEKKTVIMISHDIGEATSVSDRVVVLTDRPASVKKVFTILLAKELGPIERRKDSNFMKYYDMIWKAIDKHGE